MRESEPTKSELLQAKQRWALLNQRDEEEARRATVQEKLEALERLMQSVDDFGWRAALDDDTPVRERWNRLRVKLGWIRSPAAER